ncbi:hypothetical protein CEXT_754221 [Caerostris extrusa]|uniref:Uncharacterized protein n=1 Tax=Caerostris extrusa TaxID=172846 RepID=A0AAV4MVR0_CAEEX|nr:hypothetical protein CEXT_754221 [Caerostris extrusa]
MKFILNNLFWQISEELLMFEARFDLGVLYFSKISETNSPILKQTSNIRDLLIRFPETQLIILAWIENTRGLNRESFHPKLHVSNTGGTIVPASVE